MAPRARSIQWRIMVWLLPLLAVVFAAVMFWLSAVLQRDLYANNLETLHRATRETVAAVEAAMLAPHGDRPWERLARQVAPREGAWVRIVGAGGRVVFSSDPAAVGASSDLTQPGCAACHEVPAAEPPDTALVPGPAGDSYQVLARPLRNDEACRGCHRTPGPNLGVVLAGQSVEPIHRMIGRVRLGIGLAGGLALLLTLVTTRVVLGRVLGRPLRALVAGARSIGGGRLDRPIEIGDRTELSVLADALNLSMTRLAEMVGRVERQRDEFGTLYHFTDQLSRAVRPEQRRLRAVELATRFLGAECVLAQADYHPGTRVGRGTITLRGIDGYEDQPFRFGPDFREGVPPLLSGIIERWLTGEFDGKDRIEEGWIVGYPVQREGRYLGMLLLPVTQHGEDSDREPADPELVRALCRHIAIAIEFSEMQSELVAQERLAAIGETIAGLAHCLKNALNALRAGVFITDRALACDDPAKLRRGWGIAKGGIRQIEGLSLDMLYYVKQRRPQRTSTNPNIVVQEVVDLLRETATEKGVELRAELDEKVGSEMLDRATIYRAILNLVTNALDACTESETGDRIVVRTRSEPDAVVLTVEDNGIGMTEEVRSRLFTRFFSTKPGRGTGLGLPVVRKIVEEHGGTVEVDSEPGRGSSFRLRLPRV